MKTRLIFATATAVGLAIAGQAYAAANTLYIKQTGTGNQANVHQSGYEPANQIGSGNDIGTSSSAATQNGTGNFLGYTNYGWGAGSDNDIVKFKQTGTNNWVQVTDNNGASGTRINNVLQDGTYNQATIYRKGETLSTIDQLSMVGSDNQVWIRQGPIYRTLTGYGPVGGNNIISLVKITGSNNGYNGSGGPGTGAPGIRIEQTGSALSGGVNNKITEASIDGSHNPSHWGPAISIYQEGSNNGLTSSIARMKGSNGNDILISEIGDWNNFSVVQGLSSASTGNYAKVDQSGSFNGASVTQFGDHNKLTVIQKADSNSVVANFTGSDNGNGSLTGIAASLLSANVNLVEGIIYQDASSAGSGNNVTYNVNGSSNLFAMAQIGGGNTIVGTVGSSGNQAAVLQTGNNNLTNFTQTGGNNNAISVSQ